MSKRRPSRHEHEEELVDQESDQPVAPAEAGEAWNTPEFRNRVLIDLAFVTAPAIVMLLLGQPIWAAGWFGVGVLVIIWQFWDQIRAFVRSFRSSDRAEDQDQV